MWLCYMRAILYSKSWCHRRVPAECTVHSLRASPPAAGFLVPFCTLSFPEQNTSSYVGFLKGGF